MMDYGEITTDQTMYFYFINAQCISYPIPAKRQLKREEPKKSARRRAVDLNVKVETSVPFRNRRTSSRPCGPSLVHDRQPQLLVEFSNGEQAPPMSPKGCAAFLRDAMVQHYR
jgi:hypothetical protein